MLSRFWTACLCIFTFGLIYLPLTWWMTITFDFAGLLVSSVIGVASGSIIGLTLGMWVIGNGDIDGD